MKNRDKDVAEYVHLFIALRRRKDNPEGKERCFRQIIREEDVDLECIEARIKRHPGVWRIHKTINFRSTEKATKELSKKLIDDPSIHNRLMSEFKTKLMKPECKAERNILLDIDSTDEQDLQKIWDLLIEYNIHHHMVNTPNGRHVIMEKSDTRPFANIPYVTMQRDGYVFCKLIKID